MDLFNAAEAGDLPRVQQLISSGANVNAANKIGETPLIATPKGVAIFGNLSVCRRISEFRQPVA
jgi:hypothetical protein